MVGRFYSFLWGVGACALFLAQALTVDAVTVQLSADRTRVGVRDPFTLTVAITVDDGVDLPDPDLHMPKVFDLVSTRSSTSTSISIVNGAVTQTRTVNVISTLKGNQEGTYTLGPASIDTGGKTFRSQAIRIEVVKGQPKPQTSAAPRTSTESMSGDQLREIEQNLFLRATPDRKSVYVGEQILLTYELYSNYQIQNPRFGTIPSYTGFWAEKAFEASRLEQRPEVVNGKSYKKSLLKQVVLFPTIPGKQKLEQLEFVCDVPIRSRRRSVFDVDDFFSWDPFRSREITVRASDLEIEVRSLPDGAPPSFSGGVGAFTLAAEAHQGQLTQGDPVTVTVTIKGQGNIHGVGEPLRPESGDFKFYDPKSTVETQLDQNVLTGVKTFEYVTIPTGSGEVTLPPFLLTYFDPKGERYRTLKTDSIPFQVTPAERTEQVSMRSTSAGNAVKLVGEDIRYIKADAASLDNQGSYLHTSALFWSLHVVPLFGLLGAWQYRRRQQLLEGDVAYARRSRSKGEAKKRLAEASQMLDAEGAAFHGEIHRALSAFLADRLNLDTADLTPSQARQLLQGRSVPDAVIDEMVAILEVCDLARFAPGAAGSSGRADLLARAEDLIGKLETST